MKYRVFDIDYDTDGEDIDLPTELTLELEDGVSPDDELADLISDETGWCVNGFNYEKLDASPAPVL